MGQSCTKEYKVVAASLGDYLQFDAKGLYLSQEIHNVFHYKVNSITGLGGNYLEVLAQDIEARILGAFIEIQADEFSWISIEAKNLTNALDFHVEPTTLVGQRTIASTDVLPSWICASFKLNRESLATRNGWKRVAGLAEDQVEGNTLTLDPTDVATIQNNLAADIIIGVINVAQPVIIKRPLPNPVPGSHVSSGISSATLRTFVGSQLSRKPGVGV